MDESIKWPCHNTSTVCTSPASANNVSLDKDVRSIYIGSLPICPSGSPLLLLLTQQKRGLAGYGTMCRHNFILAEKEELRIGREGNSSPSGRKCGVSGLSSTMDVSRSSLRSLPS